MSVPSTDPLTRLLDRVLVHGLGRENYRRYFAGLGLQPTERVLDVGAGSGGCTHQLALLVPEGSVVSLEISERWSKIARGYLGELPNVEYVVGNGAQAQLVPASFDAANVHFMLHDVGAGERARLLRNVASALRPGGRLFMREPLKPPHGITFDDARGLAEDAGFEFVSRSEERVFTMGPVFRAVFRKA